MVLRLQELQFHVELFHLCFLELQGLLVITGGYHIVAYDGVIEQKQRYVYHVGNDIIIDSVAHV